jgi:hypothetical protein
VHFLRGLLQRAKRIYQTEGLASLLRRALAGLTYCLFEHRTYLLVDHATEIVRQMDKADLMPRATDCALKIVSSNGEADGLESQGLEFRSQVPDARERLRKGAVAFVVFVGREFASIAWVAMSQEAADALSDPPVQMDFAHGEAWAGGSWTSSEYRRMGLYRYNTVKMVEYWLQKGTVKNKWAIATRNVASLSAESRTGNVRYAEGRLLKVLWCESWKEKRLTAT